MSASLRPRGPLPQRVYWVRRAIVLGLPLLLIVVVARLLITSSDGADEPGAAQTASLAGQQTQRQALAGPTIPAVVAPTPTTPPEPVPAEPEGVCADSDVVLTPSVPGGITPDGLQVDFTVTTTTSPACYWTFSPETVSIAITSGSDDIWFSRHCGAAVPTQELVVRNDTPAVVPMMWNLRRSDEECSRLTEWARLGFYHVSAAALGGEPTSVQFELTRPPAEVVTQTAEPEPQDQGTGKGGKKKKGSGGTDGSGEVVVEGSVEPNG